MCVIAIADDKRPTEVMVGKMFAANDCGAGIAWREDGLVRWEKGLEEKEIQKLCKTVPMPYIAHFRIPTVGGKIKQLCHPFPMSLTSSPGITGKTKDFLLFHNGHWKEWRERLIQAALVHKLPPGKWSDSRAIAWIAGICGKELLDLIDEKIAIIGPGEHDLHIYGGTAAWTTVNEVLCSNTYWEHRASRHTYYGDHDDSEAPVRVWNIQKQKWTDKEGNVLDIPLNRMDKRLPEHYKEKEKKETVDAEKKVVALFPVGPGGGPAQKAPFELEWEAVDRKWQRREIGKKAWKRARKKYENLIWQRAMLRQKRAAAGEVMDLTVLQ